VKPVSVSNVVTAHVCPRRLYFEKGLTRPESPRYNVCKQISYHLGEPLDREAIWREVLTVMPSASVDPGVRSFFDICIERCRAARWPLAVGTDVAVASERLGIRGLVDRVFDGEPAFAITRSTEPPKAGVYIADRVRIACYTICLQETLDRSVERGYVEYIPAGIARPCIPQPRDRRAVLQAISAAKKVMDGEIPKRPLKAPCENCPHAERCLSGPKRLSDLL